MKLEVFNINNKHVETLEVTKDFVLKKNYDQEVYLSIVGYLASKRQGTSKVKGRSEVKGSTKKPWRQKGTGRARVGTKKSPIWRGGGVVFGPTGNQNYTKKQNKKSYKNAMLTVLYQYLKEKKIICYDNFPIKTPQTKAFFNLFKKKNLIDKKILLITKTKNEIIDLSTRNLPKVIYKSISQVNVYDILNAFWIVLDKEAYIALKKKWGLNE